jgi:hypothetical protein
MLLDHEKTRIKEIFKLIGFHIKLDDIKNLYVEFVLENFNWNRTNSAKSLCVSIRTLRHWYLRKKSVEIPEDKLWKRVNFGKK